MFDGDSARIARRPHPGRNPVGVPGIPGSVASTDRATTPHVSAHDLLVITNPPLGHPGVIGVKHAERWVRQGRAFFEAGGKIRLFDRHRNTLAHSIRNLAPSGPGYDAIRRQMTTRERRAIPISQPPPRPTKRKIGEGAGVIATHARNGRVTIVYSLKQGVVL